MTSGASRNNSARGFTLIELLTVISIIGILATLTLVGQRSVAAKQRDVRRVSNIDELQKGLSLYIAQAGQYPAFTGCIDGSDAVTSELVAKSLISAGSKMSDPTAPSDIAKCYYYVSTGSTFSLRYTLESTSNAGTVGDHLVTP